MNKNIASIIAVAFMALLASCTKVVNIDLNSSSPKLVIEGKITNEPGPYRIHLTQSVNFDQSNTMPNISGAVVTITDQTAGITDTLAEEAPGWYFTSKIEGKAGHTYHLNVTHNNNSYTSVSTMPQAVPLDSLYSEKMSGFGRTAYNIIPVYTDPAGVSNFYYVVEYINGKMNSGSQARSDELSDGLTSTRPLFNQADDLVAGDSVMVELQSIDKGVYDFFRTLNEAKGGNQKTPANPLTNITGGALGYFSAYSVQRKSIVVH